ncbi:hypothetical protein R3P38DRAFT_3167617 [Favolaschia claudopus]|uniref:Uncharacterized protein n=1 Tax=Favolaschia claudopus TaxID=2862362 RepID=A0AAW0E5C5_9AGAR
MSTVDTNTSSESFPQAATSRDEPVLEVSSNSKIHEPSLGFDDDDELDLPELDSDDDNLEGDIDTDSDSELSQSRSPSTTPSIDGDEELDADELNAATADAAESPHVLRTRTLRQKLEKLSEDGMKRRVFMILKRLKLLKLPLA